MPKNRHEIDRKAATHQPDFGLVSGLAEPLDNRISYGCINVSAEFYQGVVSPAFTGTRGIVYVLPETGSLSEVFSLHDDDKRAQGPLADPTFGVQQRGGD